MKRWIALALVAWLALWQAPAQAQGRTYTQPELDALLAPVALYPDAVLSDILVAATYPDELRAAAAWSRANPHLRGDDALRAAEALPWHPSVKALLAFPDLLARMDESPQWSADLGAAFLGQEPHVMDTVQALRRRAQASGSLESNDQYSVQQQGSSIAVYPAQPQVVYVPYYDPYVVYGPWWWHSYRPVYWRPWHLRPAFASVHFFKGSVDWHRRHVVRHHHHRHHHNHRHHARPHHPVTIHNHARPVRPIVDSVRLPQPAAQPRRHQLRREVHRERRAHVSPPAVVRTQPAAQPRRHEPRREVHRERRAHASPPAVARNHASVVRPIVDSVRMHARPAAQANHFRQPHRQESRRHQQRRGR